MGNADEVYTRHFNDLEMRGRTERAPEANEAAASLELYDRVVVEPARQETKLDRRWYWLSATVLALGTLSLALVIWVHHIHYLQRAHFAFANTLMDLRIRAATSHLWLEEAITGGRTDELERAWADLRETQRLAKVLVYGGDSEYDLIVYPQTDPALHQRSLDVERLSAEWGSIVEQRVENAPIAGVGSALDNRSDAIFDSLQNTTGDLERSVESRLTVEHARGDRLVLALSLCWVGIITAVFIGVYGWQRSQMRAEDALQSARDDLERKVVDRTCELRKLNGQLRFQLGERKRAEEDARASERQLRYLSTRLLTVQENERSRISKELHDHLGHSLILIKMRLGLVRGELGDGHQILRDQCDGLLGFVDQTIEDARRLAKDLRPSVLDTLGLSGALSWLLHNIECRDRSVGISGLPRKDIDLLFSPDVQVLVFRTIQEALTNVEKHANARRVTLCVEMERERVRFIVEDSGIGFDVNEALGQHPDEKGLGLAIMDERARMARGSLTVWSERGKGSRITLSVPAPILDVACA